MAQQLGGLTQHVSRIDKLFSFKKAYINTWAPFFWPEYESHKLHTPERAPAYYT